MDICRLQNTSTDIFQSNVRNKLELIKFVTLG